ncbi:MAG: SpoIID/LytB domain-containing protein [Lachnospiraceae bacterium]
MNQHMREKEKDYVTNQRRRTSGNHRKRMGNGKKMICLGILILLLAGIAVLLVGQILGDREDYEGITNGEAAKLLFALENDMPKSEGYGGAIGLADYLQYVNEMGILHTNGVNETLRNRDLENLMLYFGLEEEDFPTLELKLKKKNRKVAREYFEIIYQRIVEQNPECKVERRNLVIAATPGSLKDVPDWNVYTDDGIYTFYGLFMDGYLDRQVSAYVKGHEILGLTQIESTDVVYHNVWVYKGDSTVIRAYVEGVDREFYVNGLTQEIKDSMADIHITDGVLTGVSLKTDTVRGKVLSVTEQYVEIEGYGRVPFDPEYKLYKNYGGFSEISYSDLLVGYELQEFIVGNGMVSGAIVLYPFEVHDIRIILRNNGFESIYHNMVEISCEGEFDVFSGQDLSMVKHYNGNEKLLLDLTSKEIQGQRIRVVPASSKDRLEILSLERSQGHPAYPGFLEISSDENGIYIVNEVNLEEYLKLVVPSEMPAGYGKEAAKVQAVCARSYAYNQLLNNDYSEYGAHIDDSTWYQVYNNTKEYETSSQGVDETCGEVMTVDGEVITAYYYSTSCGHGSDISIWGQSPDSCSYIKAHSVNADGNVLDLTSNDAFYEFISRKNKADFDSNFALYRWKTKLTMKEINTLYGDKAGVGEITSMDVISRFPGGCANEVVITGKKGTYLIEGEAKVRRFFGDASIDWKNNNDKQFNMASLPSAFIALNPVYEKNQLTGYEILGGGFGHGLGMSQNGAYAMTREGYTYEEILHFFYQNIELTQLY